MNHKLMLIIISLFTTILLFSPSLPVNADDDHKEKKWFNKILGDDDDDSDHHQ